jgi:hypothetical protein
MSATRGDGVTYAYELVNPYHPERGLSGTVWFDEPLRVRQRLRRGFADPAENADTHEITVSFGPVCDWEVVAIDPTERDGQPALLSGNALPTVKTPTPIMQGRLTLFMLG